jgi:hypothetical protein
VAELLHQGSGWGALERRRRQRAGERPFAEGRALPFPDSAIGDEQLPWLALLETGLLPARPAAAEPGSLMVQPEWHDLLERSVRGGGAGAHGLAWYHLGVMRYHAGDRSGARDAWQRSARAQPSAWAWRDLAVLAREQGDAPAAVDLWLSASRAAPALAPLAIECASALLEAGRAAELGAFADTLPPAVRAHGRIRLLRAMAALALDDLDAVKRYFQGDPHLGNVRESETVLSDLWFGWHERRLARERGVAIDDDLRRLVRREFPPPARFDFRMDTSVF